MNTKADPNKISISVFIPTYNSAHDLPRAIESVLAQSFKPYEIIVADDGSTDNTREVVATYGEAVRYARFEHAGVYSVRNSILAELKGEWFFNLDSDNWIAPDFLEKAAQLIAEQDHAKLAFVYPDMEKFGEVQGPVIRPEFCVAKLKTGNYVDMNSLIKTDVARRFGFDPDFNSGQGDYDFFLTLVENGFVGIALHSARLHYCVRKGSISYEGRRLFRHVELANKIILKHATFFSKREAKKLRSGASKACANTIWSTAAEEYEIARYQAALSIAVRAIRCDWRMLSVRRIYLFLMSLVVCASGGILWLSRPVEFGETQRSAWKRVLRRAGRKFGFWWSSLALKLGRAQNPIIWVVLSGGKASRSAASIRTRRSVEMQDYAHWRWLSDDAEPADSDYVVVLSPGDELYPDALFRFARESIREAHPEIVYADHAWWNGAESFQPCWKPQFSQAELRHNLDVLQGSMMIKSSIWQKANGNLREIFQEAVSVAHLPVIVMNRHVPYEPFAPTPAEEQKDFPRVACIIPTKNRATLLANCIRSIQQHTAYTNYEIVIIDNGSTDPDAVDYLDRCELKVIRHPEPFNFSELNNIGATATDTPLLLFLNDDIEVLETEALWLSKMVETILEEGVGVVGAQLEYPCGATQHAGIGLFRGSRNKLEMRNLFCGQVNKNFWVERRRECLAVTGACQLVRREAFGTVKGYDESLSIVCNDVDFCLRIREAKWKILYQPCAKLVHHEGISSAGDPSRFAMSVKAHSIFDNRWMARYKRDPFVRQEWERGL